jgi:glutamyl-Q tRNA(Asp) synthetase
MSAYRGRFAPTPTGPLHFGSLIAAVGSYLDAKHHNGTWLIRMEDLDTPRCVPGAADDILRTLSAYGLYSDEPVMYQSRRTPAYETALSQLQATGATYPCACTRREIADSSLHGIDGPVYPGTCRNGISVGREGRAWRVRTNNFCQEFDDALQGHLTQNIESEIGDFVVKRADSLFAYQMAVVVDDAAQKITHVVRGADLLSSTPRQIYLQRLLNFSTPTYLHLPVAVNQLGEKLSKQTRAKPVNTGNTAATLRDVLHFLNQHAASSAQRTVEQILAQAIANWRPENIPSEKQLTVF